MSRPDAEAVSQWRYPELYALYSLDASDSEWLLTPDYNYHSVRTAEGQLAGYFCFGPDAQVPAGHELGLYESPDALDVGLGMRPDLTGQGLGRTFLEAGLEYASEKYKPARFRLTVATFNRRAVRLYESAGFRPVAFFQSPRSNGALQFLLLERSASPPL